MTFSALFNVIVYLKKIYINPRLTNGGCCKSPYGFFPVALKR